MTKTILSRRGLLRAGLAGACSAAAHPLLTTMTFAAAPWEARLVVIILRGAMDGLDAVQPYGDPLLAGYRPNLPVGPEHGARDLDGFFAMHPALGPLWPLWQAGELGFVHAVSTPYRDKRSHFDGQDLLEAGTAAIGAGARGGWLNRFLQVMPGVEGETAFAVGRDEMRVLDGTAPAMHWSPDVDVTLTPETEALLTHLYARDPLFAPAAAEGMALAKVVDRTELPPLPDGQGRRDPLAAFAADRLRGETRIAAYSLNGWDTHQGQAGGLKRSLGELSRSILTLRDELGGIWSKTAVLAMTEFGRTARENGSRGTDHGTGGAMLLAGGALRGGRVYGRWPGLDEADLYAGRDLMPTADVRAYAAWAMRGLYGIGRDVLEDSVFPGLAMEDDPRIVA